MQYLLDTNMCVFFLRGKLNLHELIRERDGKIVLFLKLPSQSFIMEKRIATIQQNLIKPLTDS